MHDYIVVGAGSAGCVVASRLSEDAGKRVLLLEAGGPDASPNIRLPVGFPHLFRTEYDWNYETEPQPALNERRLYWPRGKMLGGCSSINAMVYVRGHRSDYDGWRDEGNTGWSYDDVLPYFKRAQDQQRGASEHHGTGGPLHVADLRCINPLSRAFVDAAAECGFPRTEDFNEPEPNGFGIYQVTQKRGQRHSAATAYLHPARQRPNLTVQPETHALRMECDQGRVVALDYLQGGSRQRVEVQGEVVLSCGAIGSPQLLLLSGIGPASHLQELGIPVVLDLPGVGRSLQDHLLVSVAYACRRPVSLAQAGRALNRWKYLLFRRGPLTSNLAEAGGFARSQANLAAPDLQFIFSPCYYLNHGFTQKPGDGFTILPGLVAPSSRGQLRLRSADPLEPPRIDPAYLTSEDDVRALTAGVQIARRIGEAAALREFCEEEVVPGKDLRSEEELTAFVRASCESLYHPTGTCRMGNDEMAVVDSTLRVRGLQNLRVADASIMPTIVRGNTNAPAIMIGEKAADMIRRNHAGTGAAARPE